MTELNNQDVTFLEGIKEHYADLYNHIVENTKDEYKAIEMIKAIPEAMSKYKTLSHSVSVQKSYTIEWLEEHTGWSGLSSKDKNKVLWTLGMDTRTSHYFEENRRVLEATPEGHKLLLKDVVWGQERLDKGWIEAKYPIDNGTNYVHYASEEALAHDWFQRHGKGAMFG